MAIKSAAPSCDAFNSNEVGAPREDDNFPSIDKRLKALNLMGAQAAPTRSSWRLPAPLLALTIGLLSIAVALGALAAFLLVMVSVAMSMLFTAFPAAILHALLRAIGN